MKKQKPFLPIIFLLVLFALYRCANPVSPTGGPKDDTPPVVVKCNPPNFSLFFHSDEIKIEFDEFVELETGNNQITISPPWLPKNQYKLRGKSVVIKIDDSLHPNTTYSINFGNSILDITENNVLANFNYVFSTGAYLDSLTLEGKIVDAFTLTPQKEALAMLYIDDNDTIPFDSLPYKVKPFYLTRTNENGEFSLKNLSDKPFKLFALKDINNDFLYNLPDEKIAFYDSLIRGIYYAPPAQDTLIQDTAMTDIITGEAEYQDSLASVDTLHFMKDIPPQITLRLFQQYDSVQRILKTRLIQEGQVGIYFRYPSKSPQFIPLNFTPQSDWKTEEINKNRDTIMLWLRKVPVDSLILQVTDEGRIIDTVEIEVTKKNIKERDTKKEEIKPKRLSISLNTSSGYLNQFTNDLLILFSYPLDQYNLTSVSLVDEKDTLKPVLELADSLKRTIRMKHKWKEDKKYRLIIPDSSFFGINELTNDSLILAFKTRSLRDFGFLRINLDIESGKGQYIIQLLNEKDGIIDQRIITGPEKIEFSFLNPLKYKIKAISDRNGNNRWDTGDYLKKIQPEEVLFFPQIIEIRSNWEVDETWSF